MAERTPSAMLDETDRKILAFLQEEGRAAYAEIGAAVGLSVSAVNERLKKLQAAGAIRGWSARVDPRAVGRPLVAFLQVLLRGAAAERRFLETVTARPEVLECHHVTGEWSYLLKLRLSEVAELEDFLAAVIKPLDGVERTHSLLALSSPKDSAVVPCDPPEARR